MRRAFFLAVLLVCAVGLLRLGVGHHTWTLATGYPADNASCTSNSCTVTVTSTTAGDLLVAGLLAANTSVTISSVSAAACSASWTHAANSAASGSGDGSSDFFYCLNSASGQTSITITATGGSGCAAGADCAGVIWEVSSSLGNIAVDSGTTPSQHFSDAACTSCAGVALSLSSNNKFIAVLSACGSSCTGLTGTGFTNDLSNPDGDGAGHALNISTSGSLTSPATWTQSSSATIVGSAVAFQETSGGGGPMPAPTPLPLMGVGR